VTISDALAQRLRELSPAQRDQLLRKLRLADGTRDIPVTRTDEPAPLSPAQERLWFLHRLDPSSTAYHMPLAVRVHGPLDLGALGDCLRAVADRHHVLRTVVREHDGAPVQVVLPELAVELVELSAGDPAEAAALARREARRAFSLERGPLVRACAIRLGPDDHVVQLAAHHIIADGWSLELLLRELATAYLVHHAHRASRDGASAQLPAPRVQYTDYARWHREQVNGEVGAAGLDHWRRHLAGAPTLLTLPTDRPRPALRVPDSRALPLAIPPATWQAIEALARRARATPFMVLLAGFAFTLGRCAGQREVVIGSPIAGRERAELRDVIGLFVNSLALRITLPEGASFLELLEQVRGVVLEAFAHQHVPFDRVASAVQSGRDPSITPVFQAMLVVQPAAQIAPRFADLTLAPFEVDSGAADHDLVLTVMPDAGGARGALHYSTALWDEATMTALWRTLAHVLAQASVEPERALSSISLVDTAVQHDLIESRNTTQHDFGPFEPVHHAIERRARVAPAAIALRFEGRSWSYAELWAASGRWAGWLAARGAGPERVVGVCMERGPELVLAALAILRAGGAYLPIDPCWPAQRITAALTDGGAIALLCDEPGALATRDVALASAVLGREHAWDASGNDPPRVAVAAQGLAYVICTSGSTGRPKAVMNTHEGLANRLRWQQQRIPIGWDDRVLHKTPSTFDVSVWELLWPLMYGATMVIARPGGHREPDYLLALMRSEAVTLLHFVPSMLDAFLAAAPARSAAVDGLGGPGGLDALDRLGGLETLRAVVCSGEALARATAGRFARRLPHVRLHNLYGPTEASIDVTAWEHVPGDDRAAIPIGHPIANTRVYVLDRALRAVPAGVVGDLYLAGIGLARGYAAAAALTAERFVPDPFRAGLRMYRTGDRARWRGDGALEFLGRDDHQVKLRGHRIELGEIEAVLARHPDVHGAAVLLREDRPGEPRLVAYIATTGAPDGLGGYLAEHLPASMVPSAVVALPALPTTASGKLDRGALPAPEATHAALAAAPGEVIAPRTALERDVAAIWCELLDVAAAGVTDEFFAVGGHSLLMMRLATRLRDRLGVDVPLRMLFDAPTIEGIATSLCTALASTLDPEEREDRLAAIEAMDAAEVAQRLAALEAEPAPLPRRAEGVG
jgi:amino acid adenylation domain-containing protein